MPKSYLYPRRVVPPRKYALSILGVVACIFASLLPQLIAGQTMELHTVGDYTGEWLIEKIQRFIIITNISSKNAVEFAHKPVRVLVKGSSDWWQYLPFSCQFDVTACTSNREEQCFCRTNGSDTFLYVDRPADIRYSGWSIRFVWGDSTTEMSNTIQLPNVTHAHCVRSAPRFQGRLVTGTYAPNMRCFYTIRAKTGFHLKLTIETFDMEETYDYMDVIDGNVNGNHFLLKRFTGKVLNTTIFSTGHIMNLYFFSNEVAEHDGTVMEFWTECGAEATVRELTPYRFVSHFTRYKGENYQINTNCTWVFRAENGTGQLSLRIRKFRLERPRSMKCEYDYVQVFDGQNDRATQLFDNLCGHHDKIHLISSGNALTIRFITDHSLNELGFQGVVKLISARILQTIDQPEILPSHARALFSLN